MIQHILFPLRPLLAFALGNDTLSGLFHDIKGFRTIQSHMDQIGHDIITRTDTGRNRSRTIFDQSLGITQPYVRTMGQAGNTDQIRKLLRLCIPEHPHGKIGTKLRDTQRSHRTAVQLLRCDPKG